MSHLTWPTPFIRLARWGRSATGVLALTLAGLPCVSHAASCPDWPLWETFRKTYITQDARVLDPGLSHTPTVSEGQAYALFFALVAGDRQQFSSLLAWTRDNLAQGDLHRISPGWHWGQSATGRWELLDSNPASDADLWLSYALLEAGRLWQNEAYSRQGHSLAARLLRDASAVLPSLGRSLLPAPTGFQLGPDRWRLNPSYSPVPLLRRLSVLTGQSEWLEMVEPTLRLMLESAPRGISPEWAIWDTRQGWQADPQSEGLGSYNAIRTYLWAGMSRHDPAFERLALGFLPWLHWVGQHGHAPEALNAETGTDPARTAREGPPGFDVAALVLADSLGFTALRQHLQTRVEASLARQPLGYYNHALALFGLGWLEGRYQFSPQGALILPCSACEPQGR